MGLGFGTEGANGWVMPDFIHPALLRFAPIVVVCVFGQPGALAAPVIVRPTADGTLVDGGAYGIFDGRADNADWYFNDSSYEGAITLSEGPNSAETRVTSEFNVVSVAPVLPVIVGLRFQLRGAPRFPADAARVQVYSFPSDLVEHINDFSAGPAVLLDAITIPPYEPSAWYEVNVTEVVEAAMNSTAKRLAFRLQISTETPNTQAFMDATEVDQATKPYLFFYDELPSDFDGNRAVDLGDYSHFSDCLDGPVYQPDPTCAMLDYTFDAQVDLSDFAHFQNDLSLFGTGE